MCRGRIIKSGVIAVFAKPFAAFAIQYMGPFDLLNHLLNFAAPALVVGALVAWIAPILWRKVPQAHSLHAQVAMNFVAGLAVLVAGLVFFGRDGKMATYAALALACGFSQWWGMRR